MDEKSTTKSSNVAVIAVFGVSLLAIGFLAYKTIELTLKVSSLETSLTGMTLERDTLALKHTSSLEELAVASSTIAALASELSLTTEELEELEDDYRREKKKNENFEDQIRDITSTVSDLDKLSKTDAELLKKYSKVYFLNEHYVPEKVVAIDKQYLYNENLKKSVHAKVEPFLNDMLDDALEDGVKIWVVSAYRSFYEQAGLKGHYTVTYGSGANAFSADQGYSEHQLGTTLDFTTEGLNGGLNGFGATPAYTWLTKNAHKYGFTLSYPENNAYYVYEPWHWRFVGEDLADDLYDDGKHFYDLDQREIDKYLLNIFD